MAISNTINRITYQGDGITQIWGFGFPIVDASNIEVWVSINGADSYEATDGTFIVNTTGAHVTYPLIGQTPLTVDDQITIIRILPLTQEIVFTNQGRTQAELIEEGLDRLTMIAQQQQEILSRSLTFSVNGGGTTSLDELLSQMQDAVNASSAYLEQVTLMVDIITSLKDEIDQRMPSGFNRFAVVPSTMNLEMAYLGETTNDQIWLEDGYLMLRLRNADKSIGRIGMVYKGTYSDAETYSFLSIVSMSGTAYLCVAENGSTGIAPPTLVGWVVIGQGGAAATVSVGSTTTLTSGSSATVTNSGTSNAAVLNFGIPRGPTGATGSTGATGTAASIAIGTTTTLSPDTPATVNNSGSSSAAVFNFGIPEGRQGERGAGLALGIAFDTLTDLETAYPTGADTAHVVNADGLVYVWDSDSSAWVSAGALQGAAGTIAVGSTTTLAAGSNATVTNTGTSSAAILNFGVPRGATGAVGSTGATGATGAAATLAIGSVTQTTPGSNPTVTNSGTSSAGIINFTFPAGMAAPYESVQTLGTVTGTTNILGTSGNIVTLSLGGDTFLNFTAGASTGFCRVLTLIITNGGAYTLTWAGSVLWSDGAAPTLSESGIDIVTLITTTGGSVWLGSLTGRAFA